MGSYDNGGTAMVDELFKVEVKVTIPKRDEVKTRKIEIAS